MKHLAWLLLLVTTSAFAADNTVIVTPGTGVTMRSKDTGSGIESMMPIPGDTSGNALATAPGTPNASFALPIQGTTSGTAVPVSGTVTSNAGTNLNTSALATHADVVTNSATSAHTCSTGGTSVVGCLGQIDDDVKGVGTIQGNINVGPTSCSIALTTGATAQNIITASATLHGFTIANIDTSAGSGEPIWINLVGTAAASTIDSFPLAAPTATTFAALSSYTTPLGFGTSHAVSVIAATTGHKISCVQW